MNVYSFLTNFKRNCIKQQACHCIIGPITWKSIFDNNNTKKGGRWEKAVLE